MEKFLLCIIFVIGADGKSCSRQTDCNIDQICDERKCIPDLEPVLALRGKGRQSPYCNTDYHCKSWQTCWSGICVQNFKSATINGDGQRAAELPSRGELVKSSADDEIAMDTTTFQAQRMTKSKAPSTVPSSTPHPWDTFDEPYEAELSDSGTVSETAALDAADGTTVEKLDVTVSKDETEAHAVTEETDEGKLPTLSEATTLPTTTDSLVPGWNSLISETNYWASRELLCEVNSDCRRSEICRDRRCISVNWLPNNIVCLNDSQCGAEQLCAVDGYCVLDPSFPKFGPRCDTDANCEKLGVCRDGRCHLSYPYKKCKVNRHCSIDEICVMAGYCVPDPHSKQFGIEPCSSSWWQFRQKCYLPVHGRFTYVEGSDFCAKLNANLVTIRDSQQGNYITYIYNAGGNGTYWIGLLKDMNRTFRWQSGEPVIYTNWDVGEPEPRIGCVMVGTTKSDGKWLVTNCAELKHPDQGFVCEKDVYNS